MLIRKYSRNWEYLKQHPQAMAKYKIWRRNYIKKKKEKTIIDNVGFSDNGVEYSNLTDLILRADLQDYQILNVWNFTKN